jgi:hypothetical protein
VAAAVGRSVRPKQTRAHPYDHLNSPKQMAQHVRLDHRVEDALCLLRSARGHNESRGPAGLSNTHWHDPFSTLASFSFLRESTLASWSTYKRQIK